MKCYKGTILSVDANDGVYRYLVEDKGTRNRHFLGTPVNDD